MKKFYKNSLYMLVAGAFMASCADYNKLDGFEAEPDPSQKLPYTEYNAIKSYINKDVNPNMEIGATLDIAEFNKQEMSHVAVMTNFENVSFGKTLMSGTIIDNELGVMNFMNLMDLLEHMQEINGKVFGSPLVANANQCDKWLKVLTAPIEIAVDYVPGKEVNFNDYNVGDQPCTNKKGKSKIVNYDGQNVLNIPGNAYVNLIEGFEVDPSATYTTTFWAMTESEVGASFNVNFSGTEVEGTGTKDGKWVVPGGKWTKVTVESKSAPEVTDGYLEIRTVRGSELYVRRVEVGYYPDNHIDQTPEQKADTLRYALNSWCDGLMKINEGRITTFDLIDEAIDKTTFIDGTDIYNLKHGTDKQIFWQDALGNENYAPEVANIARAAFSYYKNELDKVEGEGYISPLDYIKSYTAAGSDVPELKFFISETGLEDPTMMKSLEHWIRVWDSKGAKIDGITAKVNLVCYEDAAKMAACKAAYEAMLDGLAKTGKLIRLTNFDIKYMDAAGLNVVTTKITDEQREALAEFNKYAIQTYMSKIPNDKQAGICKNVLADDSDPTGLWTPTGKNKTWIRNATYKAWCEALGGK